ncbi:hypothetical protein QZH41_009487 [Actinostola sp. cb2023]|nr:hypothetical protein QZH41_009487 [Actinostola sp. cb2023]
MSAEPTSRAVINISQVPWGVDACIPRVSGLYNTYPWNARSNRGHLAMGSSNLIYNPRLCYIAVGNSNVIEGDIHLDKNTQEIMDILKDKRDAITDVVKHWTGARVPYMFGGVSPNVRRAFYKAISDYHLHTCIRFRPRRNERNYIYVVSEGGQSIRSLYVSRCWSSIGKSGGRQKLSLGQGCENKGTAIHEIMHALGFFHEQSRRDRDSYITIYWGNIGIRNGARYNFEKYPHGKADTLNAPYDYGSIMHCPEYAFTRNGRKTIAPKRSGVRIGQRRGLSKVDIQKIKKLYGCSGGGEHTRPPTRPPVVGCVNQLQYLASCPQWAVDGYCIDPKYTTSMEKSCRKSCGFCLPACEKACELVSFFSHVK